jgi:hypothetical protein
LESATSAEDSAVETAKTARTAPQSTRDDLALSEQDVARAEITEVKAEHRYRKALGQAEETTPT